MEILLAFLVGVALSAAVAYFVYRSQRREQLESEAALLQRLAQHGEVLGVAASTGYIAARSTARLERDVSILRRQLTATLEPWETVRDTHLELARDLLPANGLLDERVLTEIHSILLGGNLDYAGELRNVDVRVGGTRLEPHGAIRVPAPVEVRSRLTAILEAWTRAATDGQECSPDEWLQRIVRLHAGLLAVHPFFDSNGLLARVLLALQTEKHLRTRVVLPRRDPAYFSALRKASEGDIADLCGYLKARMEAAAQQRDAGDGASHRG